MFDTSLKKDFGLYAFVGIVTKKETGIIRIHSGPLTIRRLQMKKSIPFRGNCFFVGQQASRQALALLPN
ncbi:MAG: hypothetical protein ACXVNM_06180 [Bacteroidia bacterium]